MIVWRTAQHDHEADDDQAHDGDELDTGEPELGFSEDANGDDVEEQDDAQVDDNPDSIRYGRGPVVQKNDSGGGFGGYKNRVGIPEIVSSTLLTIRGMAS